MFLRYLCFIFWKILKLKLLGLNQFTIHNNFMFLLEIMIISINIYPLEAWGGFCSLPSSFSNNTIISHRSTALGQQHQDNSIRTIALGQQRQDNNIRTSALGHQRQDISVRTTALGQQRQDSSVRTTSLGQQRQDSSIRTTSLFTVIYVKVKKNLF